MAKHISTDCIVCKKHYNNNFYDKGFMGRQDGKYYDRFLCSKKCRDIFYDEEFKREQIVNGKRCRLAKLSICID